jgi:hypothetical protein
MAQKKLAYEQAFTEERAAQADELDTKQWGPDMENR